jgi:hypothetical protein
VPLPRWIFGLSGRCGFSRDRNDDLAACVSGFDVLQSRRGAGQWVGPVDDGAEGAGVDQFGHGEQALPGCWRRLDELRLSYHCCERAIAPLSSGGRTHAHTLMSRLVPHLCQLIPGGRCGASRAGAEVQLIAPEPVGSCAAGPAWCREVAGAVGGDGRCAGSGDRLTLRRCRTSGAGAHRTRAGHRRS